MKNKKITILVILLAIILLVGGYFIIKKTKKVSKNYDIETISKYKYFVVKENNKYGVIDAKGNKIIETTYDEIKIPNPEKDIFICYEKDNTKVLNEKSEEILAEYKDVEPLRLKNVSSDLMYEKNILKYNENGKYGIIDFNGIKKTKAIYEEIDTLQFKEGELLVKQDGKYGVININGNTLVNIEYDKIETDKFYEKKRGYRNAGYIVSKTTNEGYRYGYVNLDGKEIIDTRYNDLYRITEMSGSDIYIICAENGKYGLMRNNKKIINNEYQSLVYNNDNNYLIALKGKKYGVISIDGKIVIPFEYKQIDITGEYIYGTTNDESVKVFDLNGQETNMDKNLAIVNVKDTDYKMYIQSNDEKTTYSIYKGNQKLTNDEYTYIQYLFDNYFIACNTNGKLGIINDNETVKVEFNYNSIQMIENINIIQATNNDRKITELYSREMKKISELENAYVENNTEYIKLYNNTETKYISKNGKEIKNTDVFNENKIYAKKSEDKWGFIDSDGNLIVDYKYDKVTELNKYNFAGIKLNGKWGVIDSNGKVLVEPTYKLDKDEPIFIGEYYQVVYGNGEIYYTK